MGVVLMLGSLAACGGNDAGMADNKSNQTTGTESEGAANNGEVEKVVFSFLAFNKPSEEREQAVEEAINNITRASIGVEVDLLIMDGASYIQQIPLMLAGGVVAQVFNTIAAMPATSSGVNAVTIIVFILIFLIGHGLNFALNLLGCFVHDLRLQCLEFFGKFYEDGGKPFQPLGFKSKYVRAKEN